MSSQITVEIAELTEKGRRVRLHCECSVDGKVVLDGEGVLSVPARNSAEGAAPFALTVARRQGSFRPPQKPLQSTEAA